MTISATVGSAALVLSSRISAAEFWTAWSVWWVGDAMGILVVASAGVRMLAELERRLGWRAQALRIVAPTHSRCRKVLSIAGMDGLLRLAATVEDARAQVEASDGEPPD